MQYGTSQMFTLLIRPNVRSSLAAPKKALKGLHRKQTARHAVTMATERFASLATAS